VGPQGRGYPPAWNGAGSVERSRLAILEAQVAVGLNPTLSASTNRDEGTPVPVLPDVVDAAEPHDRGAHRLARSLPRWAALPAAVVLIAVVALASRSTSGPPLEVAFDGSQLVVALRAAGYVAEFLGVAGLLAAAILYRGRVMRAPTAAKEGRRLPPMPWWAQLLALAAIVPVFLGQVAIVISYILEIFRTLRSRAGSGPPGTANFQDLAPGLAGRDTTSLVIAIVVVAGLFVLLLAVVIRWRIQDRRFATEGGNNDRTATEAAVDVSLDALRNEPDPRRAVIAAYAAMERALSSAGLGRRRSEAPMEYVRRVLTEQTRAPEEVRTVTDLFQVAKFSHHAVDEDMRRAAIDALERIRAATQRLA
jgi:hypothetical protein